MYGIQGIEIYFPRTYVEQSEYQKFKGVSDGKYTKGLGQLQLSFVCPLEDINSVSLTVVKNLLKRYNIKAGDVGRLEVGTETLIDKSKSTKTTLMSLFGDNHDIEGATSVNACYGATNALINTLNWMASPFWDGRYGIVVAADLAVYEDGPARCTGGAGAVAILLGPNPKLTFNHQRASYIDHQYDFYKPIPGSQYPIVDGKLSIDCYLKAIEECYNRLKIKTKGKNILRDCTYFCFHSPFYKMVQKSFSKLYLIQYPNASEKEIGKQFMERVHPSAYLPQRLGNIYTGSLFSGLISLFITLKSTDLIGKDILLFSYGSGLCSSMLTLKVCAPLLSSEQIEDIQWKLNNRIKVSPEDFTQILLKRQKEFGKFKGLIAENTNLLFDGTYYLFEIDEKWRRKYNIKEQINTSLIDKNTLSKDTTLQRLERVKGIVIQDLNDSNFSTQKFQKLSIKERRNVISERLGKKVDSQLLESGGINVEQSESMIENVIGRLSLPLAIVPDFVINNKKYTIPMCIEQSSVVAACSSIGKLLAPYSFYSSSTPSFMIGQVHIPQAQTNDIYKLITQKANIVDELNKSCELLLKVGGGVTDFRMRQLNNKQFVAEIVVNVCEAMGANMINFLCEKAKCIISQQGIKTGIAVLSNYCIERKALSYFEIPVKDMAWKGFTGEAVVQKILEAYEFARNDRFRAATHNKGILNGIDAVCVATGQDWRAIQSAAHTHAARSKIDYMPLSHYQVMDREGVKYLKGSLQIPISVGIVGGSLEKNPLYKLNMEILGNPKTTQQFAEIIVSVGLAQNLAALRALAIEGIQKGHMFLHGRALAQKAGVPKHLIDEACRYLAQQKDYTEQGVSRFIKLHMAPKL